MQREIIVLGFPKCGTTALFNWLSAQDEVTALTTPEGDKEYRWPLIKETAPETDNTMRVHKFVGYVYNKEALAHLAEAHGDALFVLCVRDVKKALLSWHGMYRRIAISGRNKNHLAYKERDFYAACKPAEFHEKFAARRLRYDDYLKTVLAHFPKDQVVVVSQEFMARDMEGAGEYLVALARSEDPALPVLADGDEVYRAKADEKTPKLPAALANKLKRTNDRLLAVVKDTGVRALLVEPAPEPTPVNATG